MRSGKHHESRDTLEQALVAYRGIGDRAGEGNVLDALALLDLHAGNYGSAVELVTQGIALQKEVGNRYDEGYGYHTLAWASVYLGRYGQALTAAKTAFELLSEVQHPQGIAFALTAQGELYTDLGEYDKATAAYEEAIEVVGADLQVWPVTQSWAGLALIHSLNGEHDTALSYTARLLERIKKAEMFGVWEGCSDVWASLVMANTDVERGDLDAAHQHYTHVDGVFRDAAESVSLRPNMRLDATAGLARLAEAQRDTSLALEHVAVLLERLSAGPVDGALEPGRVYLTRYRILAAHDDPRALPILEEGYRVLRARAATLEDTALHTAYLTRVTANRQLIGAYTRLASAEQPSD